MARQLFPIETFTLQEEDRESRGGVGQRMAAFGGGACYGRNAEVKRRIRP